jgi:3-oxoacyl-[acyl-carrier-protein] synthase II
LALSLPRESSKVQRILHCGFLETVLNPAWHGKARVAITGIGVLAANGTGKDAFWQSLLAGKSGIGPITLFDATGMECRIAGEVKGFNPLDYIPAIHKPEKRMSRTSQLAVAATQLALKDAGLDIETLRSYGTIPVVMGVSTNAMDVLARPPTCFTPVAAIPSTVASAISFVLGFNAELTVVSHACASGMDAMAAAADRIRSGKADLAIAGGADSNITRYVFECFIMARKLSCRNDDPTRACRPFDRDCDGSSTGEGAGLVVLENLEHAVARGATVYAEITGYGSAGDLGAASPEGSGMAVAMQNALANAGMRAEKVDFIHAHGPGDRHMDLIETETIKAIFGKHAYCIPVTSIKGMIGNPMGAVSAIQLIATALTIRHGRIPPTVNLDNPRPECDFDFVRGVDRRMTVHTALVNTHGFARGNSSMILERFVHE